MKNMTIRGLLLITLFAFFTNVYSQGKSPATAQEKADKATNWMKTHLKLTDDQFSKVQAINQKYAQRFHELKDSSKSQSKQEKLAVAKREEAAMDGELKGVLNDEQFTAYQSKKKEMNKEIKDKKIGKKDSSTTTQ